MTALRCRRLGFVGRLGSLRRRRLDVLDFQRLGRGRGTDIGRRCAEQQALQRCEVVRRTLAALVGTLVLRRRGEIGLGGLEFVLHVLDGMIELWRGGRRLEILRNLVLGVAEDLLGAFHVLLTLGLGRQDLRHHRGHGLRLHHRRWLDRRDAVGPLVGGGGGGGGGRRDRKGSGGKSCNRGAGDDGRLCRQGRQAEAAPGRRLRNNWFRKGCGHRLRQGAQIRLDQRRGDGMGEVRRRRLAHGGRGGDDGRRFRSGCGKALKRIELCAQHLQLPEHRGEAEENDAAGADDGTDDHDRVAEAEQRGARTPVERRRPDHRQHGGHHLQNEGH